MTHSKSLTLKYDIMPQIWDKRSSLFFTTFLSGQEYNVRVASRYFKGPELLVDYQGPVQ